MADSSELDKFKKTVYDRSPYQRRKRIHPKGYEPGIKFSEQTRSGEIISSPQKTNDVDWQEQLSSYFDFGMPTWEMERLSDSIISKQRLFLLQSLWLIGISKNCLI